MDPRVGETHLEELLEQTIEHCRNLSVAKKEALELEGLCTTFRDRIRTRDHAFTPRQSTDDDLKSKLFEAGEQLAVWSSYNFAKSLMKREMIKEGVRKITEDLKFVASGSPTTPSTLRVNTLGGGSVGGVLTPGGVSNSSAVTVTSRDNHESLLPQTSQHGTLAENNLVEAIQPPSVKRLNGEVEREGEIPFAEGRYCEVWEGLWRKGSGGGTGKGKADTKKVALKVLKTLKPQEGSRGTGGTERARESLENVLPSWAELHHPNILPFYGIVTDLAPRLYMVFPWRENGHLFDYVKKQPPKSEKDKYYLLRGSAAGLSYLHSRELVHGSVRCNNVFLTDEGEPQICDFGIAKIFHETHENTVSKTMSPATNVRYAAPELIKHNNFHTTTHSDTYSFALLILECITEAPPFSKIPRDAAVAHARIHKEQCPPRPVGQRIPDDLWDLMNRCWSIKPEMRPPMDHVHRFFLDRA
ncbi:kinase-like domain-containing protein [Thelephora terrestris]|uniref:Kinase-like domain-containing protein n=1 Tax=Thelephora terrestris TaxID=56493 RepID=A0A9P6HA31_9AGAM|nr:kinase-like domain-containing protein [Thelephora terrestris]